MKNVQIINFKSNQAYHEIIFDEITNVSLKRIFYIYDVDPSMTRGKHANIKTTMCLIALQGYCKLLIDNGKERKTFLLDSPNTGILCYPVTWKEMSEFSSDCILQVLCDTYYDPSDYINDYNVFKQITLTKV